MAETPPTPPGPGWRVRESAGSPVGSSLPPGSPVAPPPPAPAAQPPPFQAAIAPPPLWGGQGGPPVPPPPPPPGGRGKRIAAVGIALAVLAGCAVSGLVLTRGHSPSSPAPVATAHRSTPASSQTPATPTDPPTSAPADVTAFADPDGYFTASFTAAPVEDTRSVAAGSLQIPYVQWANLVDVNVAEVVAYANYPTSVSTTTPNAVLAGSLAGAALESKGILVSRTFGTFQGFHDADGIISSTDGYAAVRVILAGHTLFEVIATGLQNPPALFNDLTASFKIVKHSP